MTSAAKHYQSATDEWRESLFADNIALVKIIAHHVSIRLPPGKSIEDLIQVGLIGLLEASRSYEGNMGAEFKSFASIRIRGAIIDELRRDSWMPRSVQQKSRQLTKAIKTVENRIGRTATDREIAAELGITPLEYGELLETVAGGTLFSLEDQTETAGPDDEDDAPLRTAEDESTQDRLAEVIASLPHQEQMVVVLYYNKGLNLREISEVLDVSESRVCQVHTQAVNRMKTRMRSRFSQDDF